jgi:hypothetical protein
MKDRLSLPAQQRGENARTMNDTLRGFLGSPVLTARAKMKSNTNDGRVRRRPSHSLFF